MEAEYTKQQHARLRQHLDDEGNAFVDANVTQYNQSIPALNAAISSQVEAKWIADSNDTLTGWLQSEGSPKYRDIVKGVAITSTAPDLAALNANIEAQVEAEWVKLANVALQKHMVGLRLRALNSIDPWD